MRLKKERNFVRQHVTLRTKPKPSGRQDVLRLKFLEIPYRLYFKVPIGYRVLFWACVYTCVVPFVIYQGIIRIVKFEYRARFRASLGDDEEKVREYLSKVKIK